MMSIKDERLVDNSPYLTFKDISIGESFSLIVPPYDENYKRVYIKCTNKLDYYGLDILSGELVSFISSSPVILVNTNLSILN